MTIGNDGCYVAESNTVENWKYSKTGGAVAAKRGIRVTST